MLIIPVGYGAKMAWDKQTNRVADWLPESFEETQQLKWFYKRFGSDELLMLSWEGCTLEDERLAALATALQQPVQQAEQEVQLFNYVWSGADIFELLTSSPLNLTREQAVERMQGWLLGPDGETTCVIARVSDEGMADRAGAVDFAMSAAERITGLPESEIVLAGPTYDGVAINRASKNSLMEMNIWSFLVCICILYLSLKSIRLTMIVFLTAIFAQQSSMAVMFYSGVPMDSVLLLVANLTFVLTIACSIHLVNYYLDAVRNEHSEPVEYAIRAALKPTLMSTFTTALGMLSLLVSQIVPVKNFGTFAAIATGIVTVVLLTLIPVSLVQFASPADLQIATRGPRTSGEPPHWRMLSRFVVQQRWLLLLICVLIFAFGISGATKLNTSARLGDLFSEQSKVVRDYQWLERHVANLIPVEIVLEFPQPKETGLTSTQAAVQFRNRMEMTDRLRDELVQLPGVGGSLTSSDFTPAEGEQTGVRRLAQHRLRVQAIYDQREGLAELGYWKTWDDTELWRISLRVSSSRDIDYAELVAAIQQRIAQQESTWQDDPRPLVYVCGGVPLVYKAQTQLLNDLASSFTLAIVMIVITMSLLVRGLILGILTLAPTVIPALLVFGTMGWSGITVEIGSMLTATVALGITVDDTLHFLTWYREGRRRGESGEKLLLYCYTHCGNAMIQTSLVCSLGLLVFSLSPFMPIARFALMMFSLLLTGVVSALLFLPTLLIIGQFAMKDRLNSESSEPESFLPNSLPSI